MEIQGRHKVIVPPSFFETAMVMVKRLILTLLLWLKAWAARQVT